MFNLHNNDVFSTLCLRTKSSQLQNISLAKRNSATSSNSGTDHQNNPNKINGLSHDSINNYTDGYTVHILTEDLLFVEDRYVSIWPHLRNSHSSQKCHAAHTPTSQDRSEPHLRATRRHEKYVCHRWRCSTMSPSSLQTFTLELIQI